MVVEDPKMSFPWVYQYLLMNRGVKFIPATPSQLGVGALKKQTTPCFWTRAFAIRLLGRGKSYGIRTRTAI